MVKPIYCSRFFIIFLILTINGLSKSIDFPILKGPYLGQEPPGLTAMIFAPGILNTDTTGAFCSVFSPDGDEFYCVHYLKAVESSGGIIRMKKANNKWTKPEILDFNSENYDNDMCLSADGNTMIFRSWRTMPDGTKPEGLKYTRWLE